MSIKIDASLKVLLDQTCDNQYAPTKTAIIERGIELALRELERAHFPDCIPGRRPRKK